MKRALFFQFAISAFVACFISIQSYGQSNPLQIPIDDIVPNAPVTPSGKLIDRFNNVYAQTTLGNLKTSNQAINCSGFIIDFEDVILGNGLGFNDQSPSPCTSGITLGEERINTVCSVFAYVAQIIDLGGANPEILFTVSDTSATGGLATASPLFFDTITTGFIGGFVYDRIVLLSGADPDNDSTTYDATVNVDFGTRFLSGNPVPWNSCYSACSQGKIDLFSILLHEVTHTLGFFSLLTKTGFSSQTGLVTGPYSIYDQFLYDGAFTFPLINGSSTFVGTAPNDLIGSWFFEAGNTEEQPLFANPYSLTPPPFFEPSSFSHFDEDRSEFRYIMRSSTSGGDDRFYTQPEIEVLQSLGYTINTSNLPNAGNVYPIGFDDFGNTTTGQQICINVIANDSNPNGTLFIADCNLDLCTGVLSGPSILIINGGGTATVIGDSICYTPDTNFVGTAHLQYCIADGFTADSLVNIINTVDVYIKVQGAYCPDDICSYVCNGSFEAGQGTCDLPGLDLYSVAGFPNSPVNNWYSSNANPDLCIRGIQSCNPQPTANPQYLDIPTNVHSNFTGAPIETHNTPNDRYIGMRARGFLGGYVEGITTKLVNTLVPGNRYKLTIWAYAKFDGTVGTANRLMFFLNDSMPVHGDGFTPTYGDYNLYTETVDQTTGRVVPLNTWTLIDIPFIAPSNTTGEQFLIIEPKFAPTYTLSFVIDDVRLIAADTTAPEIIIKKTVTSIPPFRHGDSVNYEISICNVDSVLDGSNVTIEDFLGTGLNFASSSFSNFLLHTIDTLLVGECDTLFLTAVIDSTVPLNEDILNCALLRSGGNCVDTTSSQICSAVTVASTDISIVKTVDMDSIMNGDTVLYSIFVINNGDAVATNVLVEDILTGDASVVSFLAPGAVLTFNNNTVQVLYDSLAIGASTLVELTVVINSNCDKIIQNCANLVSIDEIEEGLSNNSSCATIVVGSGSDSLLIIDSLVSSPATCFDTCNGSASVFVCGGIPPLTYQWNDLLMQTTFTAVNLCAGWYEVTVTDLLGSIYTDSVNVVALPFIATTSVQNSTSCIIANGEATVTVLAGGVPPYSYLWETGDTTQTITGLTTGSFDVTVTDAIGCVAPTVIAIVLDSIPLAEVKSSPCTGVIGPDIVNINYTYLWAPSTSLSDPNIANPIADPNTTTSYSLVVTDPVSGCSENHTITVNAGPYDYIDHTINGNVTWTTPKKIKDLLTISPGATLTIENTTVEFGPFREQPIPDVGLPVTGIFVAPGAELIVRNTTLTTINDCNTKLWAGIQVWGDLCKNCNPSTLDHGKVTIQNNSEIKNARVGVAALHEPPGFGSFNLNLGAGIIKATNSKFINCYAGIGMGKSLYNSESQILGCDFISNQLLADQNRYPGQGTEAFIGIAGIDGAEVIGNTFNNSNPLALDNRSTGIQSFDAGYKANSNTFQTLTKGIDASGTGIVTGIIIRNNTFTDTRQGITCQGNNFDDISSNTFNVLDGEVIGLDTFPTWAAFMYNTTGFIVTENSINTDSLVTDNTYGVVVRNSDGMGGEVYKNDFTGAFLVASQMEQDNSILQVRCNEYIDVSSFDWAITSGILDEQAGCLFGDDESPAGNRFHLGCSGQEHIFKDGSVPNFIYNSHPNIPPSCYSVGVNVQTCGGTIFIDENNACPDLFITGGGGGQAGSGGNNGQVGQLVAEINKTKDTKKAMLLRNALIRLKLKSGETEFARNVLFTTQTEKSIKILVADLVERKTSGKVIVKVKNIPSNSVENIKFKELFTTLEDINKQGRTIEEMTVAEELVIKNVANSNTTVSVHAQSILAMISKGTYNRKPERINLQSYKMTGNIDAGITQEEGNEQTSNDLKPSVTPTISLAPNPFKESTTITYQLPFSTEYGEMVIYNTVGHVVAKYKVIGSGQIEFPNSNLSPGIYVCNYAHGNRVVKSLKMVIIK